MSINYKKEIVPKCMLQVLANGETFLTETQDVYLKTDKRESDDRYVVCVHLTSGAIAIFKGTDVVQPVSCELTVDLSCVDNDTEI